MKICDTCHIEYHEKKSNQRFCSQKCKSVNENLVRSKKRSGEIKLEKMCSACKERPVWSLQAKYCQECKDTIGSKNKAGKRTITVANIEVASCSEACPFFWDCKEWVWHSPIKDGEEIINLPCEVGGTVHSLDTQQIELPLTDS